MVAGMIWLVALLVVILSTVSRISASLLVFPPAVERPPARARAIPTLRFDRSTPRTTRAP